MIAVSDAWRSAHMGTLLPESYVELTYRVTDPGAHESAKESNNGSTYYSDHESILDISDKSHPKYATLEQNMWSLDGSLSLLPNSSPYGDTGYVSEAAEPIVALSLPEVRSQPIPGITVTWSSAYGEYATRCRVTAYNNDRVVSSQEFNNDSVESTFEMSIADYNKVTVEILEWVHPDHRARIEKLYLGVVQTYTRRDLISYKHSQTADLLSAELPKNSINFSLDNSTGVWNPENPVGNVKYLADRQEITVRYGFKINGSVEWIKAGTFWISEWETPSNGLEANFTARDLIEFMSDVYTGPRKGTLYEIATAAITQAEIPATADGSPRYYISDDLKSYNTDFSENVEEYTIAVILQMCANAGCCVIRQDRNGILRIERMGKSGTRYAIGKHVSYSHPEYSISKPLRKVIVNSDLGQASTSKNGEIVIIENPVITTDLVARRVADWATSVLKYRKNLQGYYRADPRVDALDIIAVESKYGANNAIAVTSIEYVYTGSFKGTYTGREVEFEPEYWFSGELRSGEV